jgi:glycosyltransferase involved in cell wall biosynthesis
LPVYRGDNPEYFRQAFTSAVEKQTLRPDEVIVVQDGPVPPELADMIGKLRAESPVTTRLVALPDNVGLASALMHGLAACSHDIVARMDADDIALSSRFERQVPLVASTYDLVGAGMLEFDGSGNIVGRRVPPVGPEAIQKAARMRDPFNHPTVVYRKSAVLAVGGYQDLALMEDYLLFARMLQSGASVANLADPLVMYRVDAGAYARRGGLRLFRSELALQRHLLRQGFVTPSQYVRNVAVRGAYRFVPTPVRRALYKRALVRGELVDPSALH